LEESTSASPPVFKLYRLDGDMTREQVLDELAATPSQLREVLAGCDAAVLERRAAAGEWSAIEVCRHLRDVVQVYGMRFKWMILDEDPFLPNYDEDRWVAGHPDGAAHVGELLDEIAAYRAETVRLLRSLPREGWSRTGRHEVLGVVELEPYVRHQLAHELQHLDQLRVALGGSG
jgi:DinB family protein